MFSAEQMGPNTYKCNRCFQVYSAVEIDQNGAVCVCGACPIPLKKPGLSRDQMQAILGGEFPDARGFMWENVDHFELEDGVWQPYDGNEILPAPGIILNARLEEGFFGENSDLPRPLSREEFDSFVDKYFGVRGSGGKIEVCIDPEDELTRLFATAKMALGD